jgi:hypothetical protein
VILLHSRAVSAILLAIVTVIELISTYFSLLLLLLLLHLRPPLLRSLMRPQLLQLVLLPISILLEVTNSGSLR